ncbi:LPXTG cell wall anchor domain-containing protein [Abyssicoccus albus]|uniref:LPXTG-motif cell wall-anchored protein n=1 Tax=Abyssicoccus albus TaxID=1817405 RepID=A0A3N5BFM3_9BACL|nr:LPXTG cell wall anchor domain-containing protein [Abyssicoccus albus]RPF56486.1 LPXTG-motif cell wall-anchored protein [Abyssicoccus albus]
MENDNNDIELYYHYGQDHLLEMAPEEKTTKVDGTSEEVTKEDPDVDEHVKLNPEDFEKNGVSNGSVTIAGILAMIGLALTFFRRKQQ